MKIEIHLSVDKMAVILNEWFKYTENSLERMKTNIVNHLR
jgi:hypothetical protein